MSKKLITVLGATGAQGGSVVDALLPLGFQVRGLTRQALDSGAATALKAKGVEVVQYDMAKSGLDETIKALASSYGAFFVTQFWDKDSMGKEVEIGKKLVDAAKAAQVSHIVWSALPHVEKFSHGKLHVPHCTDKAKVEDYIRHLQSQSPRPFKTATYSSAPFYYQNFAIHMAPKLEGDTYVFTMPDTRFLTSTDVRETGDVVAAVFNDPEKFDGKLIEYWGEHAHPQSYVDTFARISGKKAKLVQVSLDVFRKLPVPHAEETADMFKWFNDFSLYGPHGAPFALHSGQHVRKGGLSNFATFVQNGGLKV